MDPQQPPAYQPPSPYSPRPPVPGQPFTGMPPAGMPPPPQYSATEATPADIPPLAPSKVLSVVQQVAQQVVGANNVLVTVSNNPSVDQLSAAVGLELVLNKLGKHATAVFSGNIPPVLEFLQPEKTLQKNTDSLRDFIIALDKAKADKLRYKIEDKFVKIFITPYRTSIDQKDLQFSQGELNVDVVIALGVKSQSELDKAITAHGQILHDATIISINHQAGASLGSINWNETHTSSLCELVAKLADIMQKDQTNQTKRLIDKQVATALLTGVMAETDRFSNSKTTPETMNMSAKLMDAGANQPLIASKLEKPKPPAPPPPPPPPPKKPPALPKPPTLGPPPTAIQTPRPVKQQASPPLSMIDSDGSLHISHDENGEEEDGIEKIHIDEEGTLQKMEEDTGHGKKSEPKPATPSTDSKPAPEAATNLPSVELPVISASPKVADNPIADSIADETLTDIEKAVHSPHLNQVPLPDTQPPPGPGSSAAPSPSPFGPVPNSTPGQSLPPIINVKPAGSLELPSSYNADGSQADDRPLFQPSDAGLASDQPTGSPTAPPPVPPPISPMGAAGSIDHSDNLSDPNAGVPL